MKTYTTHSHTHITVNEKGALWEVTSQGDADKFFTGQVGSHAQAYNSFSEGF